MSSMFDDPACKVQLVKAMAYTKMEFDGDWSERRWADLVNVCVHYTRLPYDDVRAIIEELRSHWANRHFTMSEARD